MNPYTKAALFVIRLAGVGCITVTLVLLSMNAMLNATGRPMDSTFKLILESLPLIVGAVLVWKSKALARRLTQDFDDDSDSQDSEE